MINFFESDIPVENTDNTLPELGPKSKYDEFLKYANRGADYIGRILKSVSLGVIISHACDPKSWWNTVTKAYSTRSIPGLDGKTYEMVPKLHHIIINNIKARWIKNTGVHDPTAVATWVYDYTVGLILTIYQSIGDIVGGIFHWAYKAFGTLFRGTNILKNSSTEHYASNTYIIIVTSIICALAATIIYKICKFMYKKWKARKLKKVI